MTRLVIEGGLHAKPYVERISSLSPCHDANRFRPICLVFRCVELVPHQW